MFRSMVARVRASSTGAALLSTGALTGAGFVISLVRDMTLAATYGGSPSLDVFFVALGPTLYWGTESANLAYLGTMPALAAHSTRTPPPRLIVAVLGVAVLSALSLAAIAALAPSAIAPGLVALGERRELVTAVGALGLLIPLLTLGGLLRATLELARRFSFWAALPAFRSTGVGVLALATAGASTANWLIAGVLAGVSAWLMFGLGLVRRLHEEPRDKAIAVPMTPLGGSMMPLILMVLIGQLAGLADNHFASQLGVGRVQGYALAVNLLAVPQGLVGGVVAAVYFPAFAVAWARGTRLEASVALQRAVRLTTYGMLPAIVIFASPLGAWVTDVVYGRGHYGKDLTSLTASCAAGLALGQLGFAVLMLQRQLLIAARTPWPVVLSVVLFVVLKIGGNALLIGPFGLAGIALASSIASVAAAIALAIPVRRALLRLPATRSA
jgi:putative peptidoglycan lipid II flippase